MGNGWKVGITVFVCVAIMAAVLFFVPGALTTVLDILRFFGVILAVVIMIFLPVLAAFFAPLTLKSKGVRWYLQLIALIFIGLFVMIVNLGLIAFVVGPENAPYLFTGLLSVGVYMLLVTWNLD